MASGDAGDEIQPELDAPEGSVAVWRTIGHALRICYGNPRRFLLPAALIGLVGLAERLLYLVRSHSFYMGQHLLNPGISPWQIILLVISFLVGIYYAATLPVLTAHVLDGRPMSWFGALAWVRERRLFWPVVLVTLQVGLLLVFGLMLCIIPGIIVVVCLMLSVPTRVLGDVPGSRALSQSVRLIKPVFFGALLLGVVLFLPVAAQSTWLVRYSSHLAPVIPTALVYYLVGTLWSPVIGVALALLYIERSGGLSAQRDDLFAGSEIGDSTDISPEGGSALAQPVITLPADAKPKPRRRTLLFSLLVDRP